MYTPTVLAVFAALFSFASAGNLYIANQCDFTVYMWHVDQSEPGSVITIDPHQSYSEPTDGSGIADKFCTENSNCLYQDGRNEIDFQYSVTGDNGGTIW